MEILQKQIDMTTIKEMFTIEEMQRWNQLSLEKRTRRAFVPKGRNIKEIGLPDGFLHYWEFDEEEKHKNFRGTWCLVAHEDFTPAENGELVWINMSKSFGINSE